MKCLKLTCPACKTSLPTSFHRRLTGFWTLLPIEPCPSCSVPLQWGRELHKKLLLWGSITRALSLVFVLSVLPMAIFSQSYPSLAFVPFALVVLIALSILATHTRPDRIYVEVAADA